MVNWQINQEIELYTILGKQKKRKLKNYRGERFFFTFLTYFQKERRIF
jgi:hypothetical protein